MTDTTTAGSHRAVESRPDAPAPAAHPGRTELGTITLAERVVTKIVAHAVSEVPNAGSAAPRILGHAVGSGVPGVRQTQVGAQPKVDVDLDMSVATVTVSISVRWPASIPRVSAAVRSKIIQRLDELTGLTITDVRVLVTDLVTTVAAPPRVR